MKCNKLIACALFLVSLFSCDTQGEYQVDESIVSTRVAFVYMANPDARYRIALSNTVVSDSLPYQLVGQPIMQQSEPLYRKESELVQQLKLWRLGTDGSETADLETTIGIKPGKNISLLQLSDDAQVVYLDEVHPPESATSQTMAQFLFVDPMQPEHVKITIMAADLVSLALAGNDINNVSANAKAVVAEFNLEKGTLSPAIALDLKQFVFLNNNITTFLYRIDNPETGEVIQNYAGNRKVNIAVHSAAQPQDAKYKHILFQLEYQSAAMPFKQPISLINGEAW